MLPPAARPRIVEDAETVGMDLLNVGNITRIPILAAIGVRMLQMRYNLGR